MDCRFADWNKTSNGRLHPGKMGKCTWVFPVVPIAKSVSFGWGAGGKMPVEHGGRYIHRDPKNVYKECDTWEPRP